MKNIMRASAMLLAATCLTGVPLVAQTTGGGTTTPASTPPPTALSRLDLGLTYSAKFIKVDNTAGPWQVMNGISADGAYSFGRKLKHFGLAADLNYESANAIKPGVNLKQFTAVAGPRYTVKNKSGVSVYAETLFGFVHAYNSVFPSGATTKASANSVAMQLGGGASVPISKTIGWRVAEVDYIGTWLPNNADNFQADIRVSTGLTFHF